jgi:hypothetical protein
MRGRHISGEGVQSADQFGNSLFAWLRNAKCKGDKIIKRQKRRGQKGKEAVRIIRIRIMHWIGISFWHWALGTGHWALAIYFQFLLLLLLLLLLVLVRV